MRLKEYLKENKIKIDGFFFIQNIGGYPFNTNYRNNLENAKVIKRWYSKESVEEGFLFGINKKIIFGVVVQEYGRKAFYTYDNYDLISIIILGKINLILEDDGQEILSKTYNKKLYEKLKIKMIEHKI